MSGDSLGDRMKNYETAARATLPRRMPVVIRVDGKAFHTFTRGCQKPFDAKLMNAMDDVAVTLCGEIQGAVFAYTQSDEISVLVHGYKRFQSEAWFGNQVQKMVSVAASIATATFADVYESPRSPYFDARAFVLPEADVCNYFIWRQQDAMRNSIQMMARALYSHRECTDKNQTQLRDMIAAKGPSWENLPHRARQGRGALRRSLERAGVVRHCWEVVDVPLFTQRPEFINDLLALEPEARVSQ